MKGRVADVIVGIFIIFSVSALAFLAFRVSDMSGLSKKHYYTITAEFDNIGGLKVRAPVAVSGVKVGQVSAISLDENNFRALVTLQISDDYNHFPADTAASIFTQGILGSNYISLTPGFDDSNLKNGDRISTTHSALVLENLIGQLIYSKSDNSTKTSKTEDSVKLSASNAIQGEKNEKK